MKNTGGKGDKGVSEKSQSTPSPPTPVNPPVSQNPTSGTPLVESTTSTGVSSASRVGTGNTSIAANIVTPPKKRGSMLAAGEGLSIGEGSGQSRSVRPNVLPLVVAPPPPLNHPSLNVQPPQPRVVAPPPPTNPPQNVRPLALPPPPPHPPQNVRPLALPPPPPHPPLMNIRPPQPENNNNRCVVCAREFHSARALFGHMNSHPDRGWKGAYPPPVFNREEFADLQAQMQPPPPPPPLPQEEVVVNNAGGGGGDLEEGEVPPVQNVLPDLNVAEQVRQYEIPDLNLPPPADE